MRRIRIGRGLTIAAAALLAACGGGGGGSGGGADEPLSNADLAGTFFFVDLEGRGVRASTSGFTGEFAADGLGGVATTYDVNVDGVVTGPLDFDFLYDVAADGALTFRSDPGGDPFGVGGFARDGSCALLSGLSRGSQSHATVLLRKGGTYDRSSLSGAYHVAGMFGLPAGGTQGFGGDGAFDGAGDGRLTITMNGMGSVFAGTIGDFTYAVAADGASTLDVGLSLRGGVVDDGELAVWGGSLTPDESTALLFAVRRAASASNATFRGAYWAVGLRRDVASSRYVSTVGTATADGLGSVTFSLATNFDGIVTPPSSSTVGYTVAPDGRLLFDGSPALLGGISADGRFACAGGGTTTGDDPMVLVLRRK
jgi:hypothetical protein